MHLPRSYFPHLFYLSYGWGPHRRRHTGTRPIRCTNPVLRLHRTLRGRQHPTSRCPSSACKQHPQWTAGETEAQRSTEVGEEGGREPVSQTVLSTFSPPGPQQAGRWPRPPDSSCIRHHIGDTRHLRQREPEALLPVPCPGTMTSSARREVGSQASGFGDILSASRHREHKIGGWGQVSSHTHR